MSEKIVQKGNKSLFRELYDCLVRLAVSPAMFIPTALALVLFDFALSYIIINKVPCKYQFAGQVAVLNVMN